MKKPIIILLLCVKEFFLKRELSRHRFSIGGYKDRLIRVQGIRFLNEAETNLVLKWRDSGKLIRCGEYRVTSTATGNTYVDKLYKYKE